MRTINYTESNMVESYSAILNSLSVSSKIEIMERLLHSLKNEPEKITVTANEFIPEKSAEQIITELRESRLSKIRIENWIRR